VDRDDPAWRGQRDYTPRVLRMYDPFVLGFAARWVWQCPTGRLVERYRRHIRDGHLDVGPGTGYFVDTSGLPDGSRVTLLDPNPNVLDHAARRVRRLDVKTVQADVLRPLPVQGPFDSAALHLVFHCLPAPMTRKAAAIEHIAAVLAPTGVFFGASVLGDSGPHTWLARRYMDGFNRQGGFDNRDDTEEGLRSILAASYEQVEFEIIGSIAVFAATGPRLSTAPPSVLHMGA
jgi:SAM-dependent methyltransferase